MSTPYLFNAAAFATGLAVFLWAVWFLRKSRQDQAYRQEAKRIAWTESFEEFENLASDLVEMGEQVHITQYDQAWKHQHETANWQQLFSLLTWPEEFPGPDSLAAWPDKINQNQESYDYWGLRVAAYARDQGGSEFNKKRKAMHRIIEKWVYWLDASSFFKDECAEEVEEHRPVLIFFLYLEYNEAVRVRSKRRPGPWARLGDLFPVLRSPTAARPVR